MRKSRLYPLILGKLRGANKVLDVGCGDGGLVNFLAKQTRKEVVGLDISDSGFDKALTKASSHGVSNLVKCIKGDAYRISKYFNKEKFDVVTMTYTLHHVKQPVNVLRQLRKILKLTGQILIVDWVFYQDKDKGECRKYSIGDLLQMMMETGYSPIRVEELELGLVLISVGINHAKERGN